MENGLKQDTGRGLNRFSKVTLSRFFKKGFKTVFVVFLMRLLKPTFGQWIVRRFLRDYT